MTNITPDQILQLLEYRDDGNLYWRKSRGGSDTNKPAGCVRKDGYRVIRLNNTLHLAHRLVFLIHHGELPKHVDHINQDKLDNRICNLRKATKSENMMNRGAPSNNTTGYKGVHFRKDIGKFSAEITLNYRKKSLGVYSTAEEAHQAYINAAKDLHGAFASFC